MRSSAAFFAPALAVVMFAPAPAGAQAVYETLADSVASAMDGNPSLMAERKVRGAADEVLEQAKGAMRPSVSFRGSYSALDQEVGRQFMVGGLTFPEDGRSEAASAALEARQTIYAGGTLTAQRRQAEAGTDAAGARLRAFEQDVILAVVSAYTDVLRSEETVIIRTTNVDALDQHVRAASDRFDVGQVTRTDVAQAQARKAGAEAALAAARSLREAARATFEQIVGRPAIQLAAVPAAPTLPGTLDEAIGLAAAYNPDLAAARAAEAGAEQGVNAAKGSLRPKLGIVGSAGMQEAYRDQTYEDTNLSLSAELSIPLYQGGVLNSRTRGARLEADRARYARLATERAVTAQATTAWHAHASALEGVTASRARLEAAGIALEGSRQELAVGTRITLDVLDQEQEYLEASLGLVEAERNVYLAAHELLAVTGRLQAEQIGR